MKNILLLYSTTDGHTLEICTRLQEVILQQGSKVDIKNINAESTVELDKYDTVVLGASIRYGKHGKAITDFIENNSGRLDAKSNAFFSVNVVARKPEKSEPETNPYLQKYLKRISWKPKVLAVFAGKIDYPSYTFFDRFMIRMIMKMTNGPTNPTEIIEFTDWGKVENFGKRICEL